MYRITVCSFTRGNLGLEIQAPSGNIVRNKVSVATIRAVLARHGHTISAEDLAAVAFCGRRCVFPGASGEATQPAHETNWLGRPRSS